MALFRIALFAVLAATTAGNLLQKGNPTKAKAKEEISLKAVEGGSADGFGPVNSEYELTGEVDEERQSEEAERGTPIEEDNMPKVVKAAEAPVEEEKPEPLRAGMEKADGEHAKSEGIFNPITGQVESSLIQVSKKTKDVDELEDTEDMDEDDASLVDDEAETMDEAEDSQVTEDEESDAESEDSSEEEEENTEAEAEESSEDDATQEEDSTEADVQAAAEDAEEEEDEAASEDAEEEQDEEVDTQDEENQEEEYLKAENNA